MIDGVSVVWGDESADILTATLTFGAGVRDEALDTVGVTHLVSGLLLFNDTPEFIGVDESIALLDVDVAALRIRGDAPRVRDMLEQVCGRLVDLDAFALPMLVEELDRDDRHITCAPVVRVLGRRYGRRGVGLTRWAGSGYGSIREADLRRHAGRFFVRGNAVLCLDGPPPSGLRLPLQPGPRAEHDSAPPVIEGGPRWFEDDVSWPVVAWRGSHVVATQAAHHLACAAIRIATAGLVFRDVVTVDNHTREYVLQACGGKANTGLERSWGELRRLAERGPTEAEMRHMREQAQASLNHPHATSADLEHAVDAILFDRPYNTPQEWLEQIRTVTADEIRACLASSSGTALVAMPLGVHPVPPSLTRIGCYRNPVTPTGRRVRRPWTKRLATHNQPVDHLILSGEAIHRVDANGDVHTIRFTDIELAERDSRAVTIVGAGGCVIRVDPDVFPGATRLTRRLKTSVDLRYWQDKAGWSEHAVKSWFESAESTAFDAWRPSLTSVPQGHPARQQIQPSPPEAGRHAGHAPPGLPALESPRKDRRAFHDFRRAVEALNGWQMHRAAGLAVVSATATAAVDSVTVMRLGPPLVGVVVPCRVVDIVDEPGRRGFAYGTLPGHPERGEEAFVVEFAADGQVCFVIRAFSRPASVLARVGGPLTRAEQSLITDRYIRALVALSQ